MLTIQVRIRDAAFPGRPGEVVGTAQPAALPHSDFSRHGGFLAMEQFFPGQEKYYKDRDFDLLKYPFANRASPGSV